MSSTDSQLVVNEAEAAQRLSDRTISENDSYRM
jgi:hypothetical protein